MLHSTGHRVFRDTGMFSLRPFRGHDYANYSRMWVATGGRFASVDAIGVNAGGVVEFSTRFDEVMYEDGEFYMNFCMCRSIRRITTMSMIMQPIARKKILLGDQF